MSTDVLASPIKTFTTNAATRNCQAILAPRQHLLIGISPINSCLSEDYRH